MNNLNPIGVFDSGVGGLSVLKCIREKLPNEDLLYIADSSYAPYGNKERSYIEDRSVLLTRFLLGQKAKAIVVACNTATAVAISTLRSMFSLPIIGMEPGVKPAVSVTKTGTIGIMATRETLKSAKFNTLISQFCNNVKITTQDCPGLVEQIEKTDFSGKITQELVEKYVLSLLEKGADTIVLGCTHFLFIAPLIEKIIGKNVVVIDTGAAVAREVSRRLQDAGLLTNSNNNGSERFWISGDKEDTKKIINHLWHKEAFIEILPDS